MGNPSPQGYRSRNRVKRALFGPKGLPDGGHMVQSSRMAWPGIDSLTGRRFHHF